MNLNKIYLGDCIDIMNQLPEKSIDLVICDLPYGTTKCKWDIVVSFEKLWNCYKKICKKNCAILLFGTEPFSSNLRLSNLSDYRYDWIWNKKRAANFLFANKQPGKITENISVFYEKQPKYNPQKILNPKGIHKGSFYKNSKKISKNVKDMMGSWKPTEMDESKNYKGKNYEPNKLLPTNILEFTKDTKRLHPTQKPIKLIEYLIKTYSDENDVVLDNCCGCGTTCLASKNLKRNFIGIEKNEEYFNISNNRLEKGI